MRINLSKTETTLLVGTITAGALTLYTSSPGAGLLIGTILSVVAVTFVATTVK